MPMFEQTRDSIWIEKHMPDGEKVLRPFCPIPAPQRLIRLLGSCETGGEPGFPSKSRTPSLVSIKPSAHLAEVRYEIRGALTRRARELEAAGTPIIKLNIGNPARYGFSVPVHLREAIAAHLHESEAYGHEQGLEEARE